MHRNGDPLTLVPEDDLTVGGKFIGGPAPPPASKQRLSVDRAAILNGTTVSTVLGCQGPKGASCKVLAALTSTEHLQGTRVIAIRSSSVRTRVVTLARRTVTIAAGTQKTISLSLGAAGKEPLARFHTLPTRLTVSLTNTAKPTVILSKVVAFKQQQRLFDLYPVRGMSIRYAAAEGSL